MKNNMIKIIPGLLFVLFLATIIRSSHYLLPPSTQKILGEVVLGMAAGLLISNFFGIHIQLKDGVRFCFGFILKLAIVLLGVRISIEQILKIGGTALLLVVCLIVLALFLAIQLGKWLQISKKLAVLIGVGTAVCGNTAISAVAPAIKAKDEEMSFAIGVNTLFGTLAVFIYPLLAQYLNLSDTFFGFWAGTAVNDTSQVVATGLAYSDITGNNIAADYATTVKLTRNALMGFVIIAITFFYGAEETNETRKNSIWQKLKLPTFVVLFMATAILQSLGFFSWIQDFLYHHLQRNIFNDIDWLTKFCILMALVAVGLNTKFASMREIGIKPFILGFVVATVLSITSFSLIYFLNLGG